MTLPTLHGSGEPEPGGPGRSDLHTHSDRTDGRSSVDDMADAAVAAGLGVWGLSDHVRASTGWLTDYVAATQRLRREGLQIRCGVEAKLLDTSGALDLPSSLPNLDYVLVADHQFPSRNGPLHPGVVRTALASGELTAADALADLVGATCAGVARSPYPAIVAHPFSLLPKIGLSEQDLTADLLRALASACLAADAAVEVNEKWRCPSASVTSILREYGVRLVTGSDAHHADEVGRHAYADWIAGELGLAGSVTGGR